LLPAPPPLRAELPRHPPAGPPRRGPADGLRHGHARGHRGSHRLGDRAGVRLSPDRSVRWWQRGRSDRRADLREGREAVASETSTEPDRSAVTKVVLDYFEGWFEGDAARMKRALHPELAKRSLGGDRRWWDQNEEVRRMTKRSTPQPPSG